MNKQYILDTLKNDMPHLQEAFGVEEIALFGSYAKDIQTPSSDIDFLVTLKKTSYNLFMGLFLYLEKKFNHKVDLVRKGSHLSQQFLNYISKDLIYV